MKKSTVAASLALACSILSVALKPNLSGYMLALSIGTASGSIVTLANENERKKLKSQLYASGQNLHQSIKDFDECKAILSVAQLDRDKARKEADYSERLLSTIATEKNILQSHLDTANKELERLRMQLEKLAGELTYQQEINSEWAEQFNAKVQEVSQSLFLSAKQSELENIYQQHDQISGDAIQLFQRLQSWAEKVGNSHESKSQIIKSLAENYNTNIDGINSQIDNERIQYLTQIEALNERVGLLQSELAGDINLPKYGAESFSEISKLGNSLIKLIWVNFDLPLEFLGHDNDSIGLGYGLRDGDDLARFLNSKASELCRALGIHQLAFSKVPIANVIQCKVKLTKPQPKTDKSSLIRSQSDFLNFLSSQPVRYRLIGSPGAGKTPTVLILMSKLIADGFKSGNTPTGQKLPYIKIEYCNPLSEVSVKNSGELALFEAWGDAKSGFDGLASEYEFRKSNANATDYKNQVGYVWIMDESDNAISDYPEGTAYVKSSVKDGGHVNMGLILLGQSAMISSSGRGAKAFSIDDQKMFTNIFLDPNSIRSFLTDYGHKFYSKKSIEAALSNLEQLEQLAKIENDSIADSARLFRFAMVTGERSPIFYQIPHFDSFQIDESQYTEQLQAVEMLKANGGKIACSHCGSSDFKRNGRVGDRQRYKCNDCGKTFTV